MKTDAISKIIIGAGLIIIVSFIIAALVLCYDKPVQNEQFMGNIPMKIYQVYDKDTGVYYAVTEKGGICVMVTQDGSTKLVDQGEGEVIHKNQGNN